MMMFTGLSVTLMMWAVINVADNRAMLSVVLFLTGFCQYLGWPSYFSYPMGLTTGKTFPVAISVMITLGNLGSFVSPIVAGYFLDIFKNYDTVFIFLGACAFLAFILVTLVEEPEV